MTAIAQLNLVWEKNSLTIPSGQTVNIFSKNFNQQSSITSIFNASNFDNNKSIEFTAQIVIESSASYSLKDRAGVANIEVDLINSVSGFNFNIKNNESFDLKLDYAYLTQGN